MIKNINKMYFRKLKKKLKIVILMIFNFLIQCGVQTRIHQMYKSRKPATNIARKKGSEKENKI